MLDIRLRDGNPEKQTFKATLGASEVSLSGSGHIGEKTSYLFSLRQSYLQLLFKMIGLPFLPNYIDGQLKDMPLVLHYLRKACERYGELRPLLRILEQTDPTVTEVGYSF